MLQIEVRTRTGPVALTLGQDSQLPQEYWVFYNPLFAETSSNGIGRITTHALDTY
jgi:hypothetical protein